MHSGRASVVRVVAPRVVDVADTEPLSPGPGEVRLRTLYSGISTGTELTAFLGTNPYLHRRWDPQRRLFSPGAPTIDYPIVGWGYEEVGEVVEVGADAAGVAVGDVVWGIWGHRSDGVLPADVAARQTLPPGVDPRLAIFARVGAVALNAVIEADLHVAETVAIFGQGVIGLLATRLACLSGADVVAVDAAPERLELARRFGAVRTVHVPAESAADVIRDLTGDRGADVCIELSGAYAALHEAVRTVCYSGRVVASGFYQGSAGALALGEEFHHNRVEIVASQISGVPVRFGNRWTKERLHSEFVRLAVTGRVDPLPLLSATVPVCRVQEAFDQLATGDPGTLQVLLEFPAEDM